MLKKVFLSAAVAALVLTACDSDNSTSAKNDDQPAANPAKTSDSVSVVKEDVSQTPISGNTGSDSQENVAVSADVPCSVEKTSANSFVMIMNDDAVVTKITTKIVDGQAEIDYVSVYDESVSTATVQSVCESNKQEAQEEENATVTCEGRTIKIHQVDDAEIGFEGALESAKNVCKQMNAYQSENNYSEPGEQAEQPGENGQLSGDPNPTPVSNSGKATCQITEKTTNTLKMVMVQPDSGTIYMSYEYANATFVTEARFEFLTTMPMDRINQYCNEAKADALEMAEEEEGIVADVNCDGYSISETITEPASMNVLPFIAPEMTKYCEEIQKTGVIPDDDDDDF